MILLPQDTWEIKDANTTGKGIFAKKVIDAGTVVGDYIGKVIRTIEYDPTTDADGLYLMYYHDKASIYPTDIKAAGAHLLNHSCEPNCWMYIYQGHTLFFALKQINADEQLTISYLLSPKDTTCNPCKHDCLCGQPACTGTMHMPKSKYEAWRKFSGIVANKTKRKRIRYGKVLPHLSDYPKRIGNLSKYNQFI